VPYLDRGVGQSRRQVVGAQVAGPVQRLQGCGPHRGGGIVQEASYRRRVALVPRQRCRPPSDNGFVQLTPRPRLGSGSR
jgi:hypothetical protein